MNYGRTTYMDTCLVAAVPTVHASARYKRSMDLGTTQRHYNMSNSTTIKVQIGDGVSGARKSDNNVTY